MDGEQNLYSRHHQGQQGLDSEKGNFNVVSQIRHRNQREVSAACGLHDDGNDAFVHDMQEQDPVDDQLLSDAQHGYDTGAGANDAEHFDEDSGDSHGGEGDDIEIITRQASKKVEKALGETRDLAIGLFEQLTIFLQETVEVEKEVKHVHLAVCAESTRLNGLQPQVEGNKCVRSITPQPRTMTFKQG
jgi:hypothetical protein